MKIRACIKCDASNEDKVFEPKRNVCRECYRKQLYANRRVSKERKKRTFVPRPKNNPKMFECEMTDKFIYGK